MTYQRLIFACALLVLSTSANADKLVVIYDSGDTESIQPYLPESIPSKPPQREFPHYKKEDILRFPIQTLSMRPGVVEATPKSLAHLHRPLFIVGSDPLSKQWLRERHEQLKNLNAVGLLVEVESEALLKEILQLTEGLQVVAASAEGFAKDLGLTRYPVLLSKAGWEQ